jgi:hypothetical protein
VRSHGGVPHEGFNNNLRSAVAHRDGEQITRNARFIERRCRYAFPRLPALGLGNPDPKRPAGGRKNGCRWPTTHAAVVTIGWIRQFGDTVIVG